MSDDSSGGSKDGWDRLRIISGILASILVPLAIGLTGHWVTSAYQARESELKDREFARKWVEISLDILRSAETEKQGNLRAWAIAVINHYVDKEIQMPEELATDLKSGKSAVPPPTTSGGDRAFQVTTLETAALQQLLVKDIDQAINFMRLAYEAWPEFRTVDETLKLLQRFQPNLTNADDPDWKTLYVEVVKSMDMRGVDAAVVAALKDAAG